MQSLTFFFFCQFALLALLVPGLVGLARRGKAKLLVGLIAPPALLPVILVATASGLLEPGSISGAAWPVILKLQLLALAFALLLTGTTMMLSRPWPLQAPAVVTLPALALLFTPLWTNPLLELSNETLQHPAALIGSDAQSLQLGQIVTAGNPLLTASSELGYDWLRSTNFLYNHSDLSNLPPSVTSWVTLSLAFAALGTMALMMSALLRDRRRPSLYLDEVDD